MFLLIRLFWRHTPPIRLSIRVSGLLSKLPSFGPLCLLTPSCQASFAQAVRFFYLWFTYLTSIHVAFSRKASPNLPLPSQLILLYASFITYVPFGNSHFCLCSCNNLTHLPVYCPWGQVSLQWLLYFQCLPPRQHRVNHCVHVAPCINTMRAVTWMASLFVQFNVLYPSPRGANQLILWIGSEWWFIILVIHFLETKPMADAWEPSAGFSMMFITLFKFK